MGRLDDHPNVVTPYRFGYTDQGAPYLVMELLRGGSLQTVVDQGGIGWEQAVALVAPIARALGRAHAEGVLHRDIKPANILLTVDGIPKLTDFGISAIREATATQLAFTLAYAPPETFADGGDRRDERSDLYSLAATLFALATGRTPFQIDGEDSQSAHLFRILEHPVPVSGLDPGAGAFLARALAKNPDNRPPDAATFIGELQATVDPAGRTDRDPVGPWRSRTSAPDGRPRRPGGPGGGRVRRRVLVAVAAGIALGLAAAALVASRHGVDPTPLLVSGHIESVTALVELPDGRIASASIDGTVQVWDPDDLSAARPRLTTPDPGGVASLGLLADGRLVAGGKDGTIHVWDPDDDSAQPIELKGRSTDVQAVAVLADGRRAVGVGRARRRPRVAASGSVRGAGLPGRQ